jgi:hypothetical protein
LGGWREWTVRGPSPERRQAWGDRVLVCYRLDDRLKAPRTDRPPVDYAIGRRERLFATVMALALLVPAVLFAVQVEVTLAKFMGLVWAAGCLVWVARSENESSERREDAACEDRRPE